ncbi:hypothetical protein F3Y22_tig00011761pilonHSYRG00067 [Hibiscus syriacus]|uniref:BHLH domain-containing protein n=1 Tax=Hibiscus syriacus TaxID=106335 RepID=A0A6A3C9I1_HIBSY|nr:hypothetical protein F3Y22_tig00011761pilonHSYRG00067 [Hibiscus syriacus]
MSEDGGHGSFLVWENQPWTASLFNSGNNNSPAATVSEDKSAGKNNDDHHQQQQQPLQDSTNTKSNNRAAESEHEMHIWTERERRKKMRNMFSGLHELLPHLPPKLERLQGCVDLGRHSEQPPTATTAAQNHREDLDSSSRKLFMADQVSCTDATNKFPSSSLQFQTWSSPNVVLNISGKEAQISMCSQKKAGLFTAVCCILEKHKVEVVSAHVSSDSDRCMFMIQARVARTGASNHQLTEAFQVEEIFKQAAAEIMCWVTS